MMKMRSLNDLYQPTPCHYPPPLRYSFCAMSKTILFLHAVFLAATFLLGSCAPFTKVYSEEEPGVKLTKYHTYQWLVNTTTKQGNSGPAWLTENAQNNIRSAFERQLSRYGFKPCDENPDLMLHYHLVIKNELMYAPDWTCAGIGSSPGQLDRCHRVQPVQYKEGTLILDFIDAKAGNQVWRGAAISVLEDLKPEAAEVRIEAAAKAIFKKYPEKPLPNAVNQ